MKDIKKIAWPGVIGTPEYYGDGAGAPKGEFTDMQQDSSTPYAGLMPQESALAGQEATTGGGSMEEENAGEGMIGYEGGIVSPVDGYDWSSYWKDEHGEFEIAAVYDGQNKIASFSCQIAETMQEKTIGLQNHKALLKSSGMIFKYSRPSDVMYHMGTVSFPIDIIFIDQSSCIKKICTNIEPGTVGVYGCSDTTMVLEISGGLCDAIGIKEGNYISITEPGFLYKEVNKLVKECGYNRSPILKFSSKANPDLRTHSGSPILQFDTENSHTISSLVSNANEVSDGISAIYIDKTIEKNPFIQKYNMLPADNDEVDGFKITASFEGIYLDGPSDRVDVTKSEIKLSDVVLGREYGLRNFLASSHSKNTDIYKILKQAFDDVRDGRELVFITKFSDNIDIIKSLISIKARYLLNKSFSLDDANVLVVNENNIDSESMIAAIADKKATDDIRLISDSYIVKTSGVPVPNSTKEAAKQAYRMLTRSYELVEKSCNNLSDNLSTYEGLQDNPESIKSTKGQYHQSMKRNSRIVKAYLIKIRDAIKILNNIRDISTTMEVVDNLVTTSKMCAETVEEVLSLTEKIENDEFIQELSAKTQAYIGVCEDLRFSIDGAKEYINSNILGLMVLSS